MVQLNVKFSSNCQTKFVACKYFKPGLQPRANYCILQGIMFLPEQELLSLLIIILILFTKIMI